LLKLGRAGASWWYLRRWLVRSARLSASWRNILRAAEQPAGRVHVIEMDAANYGHQFKTGRSHSVWLVQRCGRQRAINRFDVRIFPELPID
jgi:hypothetical protein